MNLNQTLKKIRAAYPRAHISAYEFDNHIWIFNFCVDKAFQSQGIGSNVIAELKKLGKTLALIPIAESEVEQTRLENFYTRMNFKWECDNKQMVWRAK